jgi:FMN phosphatase YigB (HAD superfamily)
MKNKKTVIMVDFGGVYFTHAFRGARKFAKKYNMTFEKVEGALMGPNWKVFAEGKCDDTTYWVNVCKILGISPKQGQELKNMWYSEINCKKRMIMLVRLLRKKYRVAALSSICDTWVDYMEEKYKISREFDEMHFTFDHGIDKSSAKFFLSAAKKMKADPRDCIVIDDNVKFIDDVSKTGARVVLFKNSKQAESQLRKMGVIE